MVEILVKVLAATSFESLFFTVTGLLVFATSDVRNVSFVYVIGFVDVRWLLLAVINDVIRLCVVVRIASVGLYDVISVLLLLMKLGFVRDVDDGGVSVPSDNTATNK